MESFNEFVLSLWLEEKKSFADRLLTHIQMDKLASFWMLIRRHKYLITLLVFGVIVGFVDENSIVRRLRYRHEAFQLRNEIERYRQEYEENTERLNELAVDSGAIERIAREKYLMKKPDEDIYVFNDETR